MTTGSGKQSDPAGEMNMEPSRNTMDKLLDVQEALIQLELFFHWPDKGTTRHTLEAMTEEGFWETGASGRRYSREFVLDTLVERAVAGDEDSWKAEDFYCQQLAEDLYLLSYTLYQGERMTRRATLWRKVKKDWVAVYHQGTVVADEVPTV
jgi:hypothetical protein